MRVRAFPFDRLHCDNFFTQTSLSLLLNISSIFCVFIVFINSVVGEKGVVLSKMDLAVREYFVYLWQSCIFLHLFFLTYSLYFHKARASEREPEKNILKVDDIFFSTFIKCWRTCKYLSNMVGFLSHIDSI